MQRLFKGIFQIRRNEIPLTAMMFSYFFLTITAFWILKPIKKGLFIGFYKSQGGMWFNGSLLTATQAEQFAKIANVGVAILAVIAFTMLARRFRREKISHVFVGFFMALFTMLALTIDATTEPIIWMLYLAGDLFPTLMVATFFAFLNDSVTPSLSKRIYGLVGLGGVAGGVFGSSFVRVWIHDLPNSKWLWICFGISLAIGVIGWMAGRIVRETLPQERPDKSEEINATALLEGAMIVQRSKYLISIVAMVGIYEIISTIIDFQFTATVEYYVDAPDIKGHFSTVYTITNWVSLGIQLFFTSFIMTRFGLGKALLFLPISVLFVSAGFLAAPILFIGSALNTADNAFNYSINQSAKEALYVPTRREEKYKAKAFIDIFVQRFAKAVGVGLSLGITAYFTGFESVRWLSIPVVVLMFIWIRIAMGISREYENRSSNVEPIQLNRRAA